MTSQELKKLKRSHTKKQMMEMYWPQIMGQTVASLDIDLTKYDEQAEILTSTRKMSVMRAARRTGKSFSMAVKTYTMMNFGFMFDYQMHCLLGAPSAEDTHHVWDYLHQFWEEAPLCQIYDNCELRYNNYHSKSTAFKQWDFGNDTWVKTVSCEDPRMKGIRGNWADYIAIDEFGNVAHKEAALDAAMYAIRDEGPCNQIWLFGSPDVVGTGEEFNKLFELGQEEKNHHYIRSYHLTEASNPFISKEEGETAKKVVSEQGWLREGLGEPVPRYGKMFPDFDIRQHDKTIHFNKKRDYNIGVDFGFNKPYACFYQAYRGNMNGSVFDPKDIWIDVFAEFSPKKYLIDRFIEELEIMRLKYCGGNQPKVLGADKAGDSHNSASSRTDFNKLKAVFPVAKYTTMPELVSKANQVYLFRLLTGTGRIRISDRCPKLKRFFAMATPDMNNIGSIVTAGWKKVKGIDDPGDGFAYGLINDAMTSELILKQKKPQVLGDPRIAKQIEAMMMGGL